MELGGRPKSLPDVKGGGRRRLSVLYVLSVQFGDKTGQAGNAIAEQRRVRTVFQVFDAVAPVGGRERFTRRAGDHAFQMNEFAFENVVMHCL